MHGMNSFVHLLVRVYLGDLVDWELAFLVHLYKLRNVFRRIRVTLGNTIVGLGEADGFVDGNVVGWSRSRCA